MESKLLYLRILNRYFKAENKDVYKLGHNINLIQRNIGLNIQKNSHVITSKICLR